MGAVGSHLAKVLVALGAQVLYCPSRSSKDTLAREGMARASLQELLEQSDVVSLHVPLTNETERLIGAEELSAMKPGAILVNTARGKVVNEEALYESLRTRHLGAAGIDVFDKEPTLMDNPLLMLDNVYATPHMAGFTTETNDLQMEGTLSNIERFVSGEKPNRLINPEIWDVLPLEVS
jgi:phosphoglycerate dehydrogenase-like enzyme